MCQLFVELNFQKILICLCVNCLWVKLDVIKCTVQESSSQNLVLFCFATAFLAYQKWVSLIGFTRWNRPVQQYQNRRQVIPRTFYWYPLSLFWTGKIKYASGQLLYMNKIRNKNKRKKWHHSYPCRNQSVCLANKIVGLHMMITLVVNRLE